MSRGKHIKTPLGRILFRASFILAGVAVIAAGSVSYAKHLSAEEAKQSAGVANMGVTLFELVENGNAANDLRIDYTKVVPGADIPGPHIRLKINSEVSWLLFVKVTTNNFPIMGVDADGNEMETVTYEMAEGWKQVGAPTVKGNVTEYTYQYNYVFLPAVEHDYTIGILEDDVIFVSQYFNHETASNFSLSFETYIRQFMG